MEIPYQLSLPLVFETNIEAANDHFYDTRGTTPHRASRSAKWRSPEWQRTRDIVLERDDYACHYCQRRLPEAVRLEVHHWVPVRVAPWRWKTLSNLVTLCMDCHRVETWKQATLYGWRYLP
jgi:5-methylcytosine-specific restriction endonuclease McrA